MFQLTREEAELSRLTIDMQSGLPRPVPGGAGDRQTYPLRPNWRWRHPCRRCRITGSPPTDCHSDSSLRISLAVSAGVSAGRILGKCGPFYRAWPAERICQKVSGKSLLTDILHLKSPELQSSRSLPCGARCSARASESVTRMTTC
jgi:hypothetical protein